MRAKRFSSRTLIKTSGSRAMVESRISRNKDDKLRGVWRERNRDLVRVLVCW